MNRINSESGSNGKNGRHGDTGKTENKVEKQLRDLEENCCLLLEMRRKRYCKRSKNIKESALKAKRGEEHSKANKR
ncbi:hypothetical protein FAZ19_09800 [Sphingobacterium alkalisoli]|uniref:Uncharacterized protein n=1 Tax=Sphingobacterium alkalisoli TaxID=1874115 RepID=A0A4U0H1H0_9SPHI|nr:hypothetical protein [Sphingobacterium alkalisoli]TJY65431.1 hypothetical protein FAZ19_09800 [Sphingobacterium alkalisoli]GGH20502.1 hypothetical protein GCM10011418_25760 [Sphingobacterium alkalisoli]